LLGAIRDRPTGQPRSQRRDNARYVKQTVGGDEDAISERQGQRAFRKTVLTEPRDYPEQRPACYQPE
jgi:hypothetical protein